MRIPILTYHSMRIHGADYASNDLVALACDLEAIAALGMAIVPLRDIPRKLKEPTVGAGVVALSCDDGSDFDYEELLHPSAGPQSSVFSILRRFRDAHPDHPVHITSFVIASPRARAELDKSCMVGKGWWNDVWWAQAAGSGLMDIANHSWDHNHDALPASFDQGVARGTFKSITTRKLADDQIQQAASFIKALAPNPGDRLFAYPYGDANAYLVDEYFPERGSAIGIDAAFGDSATYATERSNVWNLPRFICGRDWTTPERLREILTGMY